MLRCLVLAALLVMAAGTARADGPLNPPGPQAGPACSGGNSVLGYTSYGSPLVCGTALSSGSIANGTAQLGVYIGTNSIGPLTIGGASDITYSGTNFTIVAGHVTSGMLASGLTIATPTLQSPTFSGTISGSPIFAGAPFFAGLSSGATTTILGLNNQNQLIVTTGGGGGGTGCVPNASAGNILIWNGVACVGYPLSADVSLSSGSLGLANNAAAFNIGALGGDFAGLLPNANLAVGASARNVGLLGNALTGTLPNPGLNSAAVQTALGTPAGDLGGSSYAAPLVTGLQGFGISSTPPTPQAALVWNGNQYAPTVLSPGINQTTGDILCGPGSGSQPCVVSSGVITNQKMATQAPGTIKANPTAGQGAVQDTPVSGGLGFAAGALQIAPTGVPAQQITVGSDCWTITATGQISGIGLGTACGTSATGDTLVADDGSTILWADDGTTVLVVDGPAVPGGSCTALAADFSLSCDAIIMAAVLH